jgi:hypothetical protein
MSLDLSGYDRPEHTCCLTARDVTDHGDLWVLVHLANNRKLVAHLLETATDLMTTAQILSRIFLHDGCHAHDGHNSHDGDTACLTGLTEEQRLQVLTLASTCAYNATLFVQEAQRRRIRRAATGWDPITTPVTA